MKQNKLFLIVLVGGLLTGMAWFLLPSDRLPREESATETVKLVKLSKSAEEGRLLFNSNCAVCHGQNASGSKNGPPLIHKIYEPSHHSDLSFHRAAKFGVRAHHWPFGNMPPIPAVTETDVTLIVAYVRELQRANGIR